MVEENRQMSLTDIYFDKETQEKLVKAAEERAAKKQEAAE